MELEFKPGFDTVLKRFEAWWHGELIDRPLYTAWGRSDRKPAMPPAKTYASLRDRWLDVEYRMDCAEAGLAVAVFHGEAIPCFYPNIGPEVCSTLFGAELEFSETTSWSIPIVENARDILKLKPNFDNPYWNTIRRATDLSIARGRGKWLTGLTDLHTNADLIASLRDPQSTCLDMADDLEGVRLACEYVTDFFAQIYDDCYLKLAAAKIPSTTWIAAPTMGRMYASSCDFICMVSPEMFQHAILPSIARENKFLDRAIFHLDGPGALKHLDALLERGNLNGIQWVYGAGNGPSRRWTDVYKRVQAAGKNLEIICEDLEDARAIIPHLRPEGVWMMIQQSLTTDEARAFERLLEGWAAGKR